MSMLVAALLFGFFLFYIGRVILPQKERKPDRPSLYEDSVREMRNRNEWP